jgi:hypothetical protein
MLSPATRNVQRRRRVSRPSTGRRDFLRIIAILLNFGILLNMKKEPAADILQVFDLFLHRNSKREQKGVKKDYGNVILAKRNGGVSGRCGTPPALEITRSISF